MVDPSEPASGDTRRGRSGAGEELAVVHREDDRFFELLVDGAFGGLLVYGRTGTRYVFTHTFIAEGYRGRGLSNFLVRSVLDIIREHHETMTNFCPVIDRFLDKNPEYVGLIDPVHPGSWPHHGDAPGGQAPEATENVRT